MTSRLRGSRLRGSANVGPYTAIVGLLRERGEVDTSFLATELAELQSDELESYLNRLARGGAIVRDGEKVRLADVDKRRRDDSLLRA